MRAFVTGGSGFVGRNLLTGLADLGHAVVALARSDGSAATVEKAGAARVVRGDLDDIDAMAEGMTGCDVVFHAAAHVEDWGDPALFHRVNVAGTQNTLDAARRGGVARFVHVGTEAVLVGRPIVQIDETVAKPERPIGLYPITKGAAEDLVIAANGDDLKTVVVRPRLVWGKGDTSVLPRLIEACEKGQFMWIARGQYKTSTCHVDNLVEGMLLAAERGGGGEIYFLTDGEPVQVRDFLTRLLATAGIDPGTKSMPRWLARSLAWTVEGTWKLLRLGSAPPINRTAVRLIGDEITVIDTKARRELGYQAKTTIEAGLAAMSNVN